MAVHPPIGLSRWQVERIHYYSEERYTSQDMAGIKEIFSNTLDKTFDMLTEGIAHEKRERFTEGACEACGNQLVGPFRIRISEIVTSEIRVLPSTCSGRLITFASRRGTCFGREGCQEDNQ